jgi:signal transduction histidine kinase
VSREFACRDEVQAFPGEMRQVFTNLVGNALEAMGQGGKLFVRVSPGRDWQNGRRGIRVLVADNGPGIAPAHLTHLFEPFFTTKGEKGTGLGLWVTHGIVRKHNGSIRVHSSTQPAHHGTAFAVFIPLRSGRQFLVKAAS